ncbi:MAG: cytochrome c, partial [Tabrizicola sp.]|nr:cytochrome c [Tabrizicola sp.]
TAIHYLRHTLVTVGALVAAAVFGGLVLMYSGTFNVAATAVDSSILSWALVTVRESSIGLHARDVPAPPAGFVADPDNGFRLYRAQCAMCHTPVGRTPQPMALGFNPQAPRFGPGADDMSAAELFWVTKNGIRFTGMPAWGPSLSDGEIRDITAFVMELPGMTPAAYDALDARFPEDAGTP